MTEFVPQKPAELLPVPPVLYWLTDFGYQDGFVGVMKSVALSLLEDRRVPMVDLSHEVPPFDVVSGAWVLAQTLPYAPERAVFVAVVDPAVGDAAQAHLLLYCPERQWVFLGPDNGLLSPVWSYRDTQAEALTIRAWQLRPDALMRWPRPVSYTFHGRDVYAPLAAQAVNAIISSSENALLEWLLSVAEPVPENGLNAMSLVNRAGVGLEAIAQVSYVDRFGNVLTTWQADAATLKALTPLAVSFALADFGEDSGWSAVISVPVVSCYAEAHTGELVALVGSHGRLELAVVKGSAKTFLQEQYGITAVAGVHIKCV